MKKITIIFSIPLLMALGCQQQPKSLASLSADIEPNDIETHIRFLADDSLKGRETGTPGEAIAANYIADAFSDFGVQPLGDQGTFFQKFTVNWGGIANPHSNDTTQESGEKRLSRNVVGVIEGKKQPDSYIILGAHYDHLGMGTFGSLSNRRRNQTHNGADDNASGTAGILELAQYFVHHAPQKSIIFVAFSAEEIGLLGSRYFVDHPPVPLDRVTAMINLDMIGHLQEHKLMIFGTGSSPGWEQLIYSVSKDSLDIELIADGTGASDHASFYNREIPVLHYFTDTHADYHRPSDDPQYINYKGEDRVLEHLRGVIQRLDTVESSQLAFTEVPASEQQSNVRIEGVTLGVTPDYGYEGSGMRITGVSSGGPASETGLQSGDVIIKLDGQSLADIYEYMEVLNTLKEGEASTVTVQRGKEELTFDIQF